MDDNRHLRLDLGSKGNVDNEINLQKNHDNLRAAGDLYGDVRNGIRLEKNCGYVIETIATVKSAENVTKGITVPTACYFQGLAR